jgi:hypothetical protein
MTHPEVFSAVASHSGDMYFEYGYLPDFAKAATEMTRAGGPAAWLRKFRAARKKSFALFGVLNIIAMTSCYSPDPRKELGCDFPFDLETGALRAKVWERWLAFDPVRMVRPYAGALRKARLVFLDAGTKDEWNLHLGARNFARRARALGIRLTHEEFDDGHMDVSYRFDVSLPLLAKAIA